MTKEELYKKFPITSLTRIDLGNAGFDVTDVTDETMNKLALYMADEYSTNFFEDSLKSLASHLNIPKIKDYDSL